jgi:hypothetical protein
MSKETQQSKIVDDFKEYISIFDDGDIAKSIRHIHDLVAHFVDCTVYNEDTQVSLFQLSKLAEVLE